MLTMPQEDLMLAIEDVAERFKVSVMTVRRIVKRGELPTYKIGGQLRFKETDVDAYIERQLVDPRDLEDESEGSSNAN